MSRGAAAAAVVSLVVLAGFLGFLSETPPSQGLGSSGLASSSVTMPSPRDAHQMAYDAESNRIVLFGGSDSPYSCGLTDTWTYDVANNAWQDMSPAVVPPGHCCAGMAYDSKADRVIMFGGAAAGVASALNDTWAYDLNANTWTEMTPSVSPPARTGGQLVYDVRLDRLILFGGHRIGTPGNLAFNDTWTYDFNSNTWTQEAPAASPSLRAFPAMAYDVESDRVVLFGGETEPNSYADSETWAYDAVNGTWAKMAPATSPARRFAATTAYDAGADRVLVFGGVGYPDTSGRNDTWAYNLNADTWLKINTASGPSNRLSSGSMAYDAASDRTVLFGGSWPWSLYAEPVYNNETWLFDRGNSTWTMVLPDIVNPTVAISSPADGATLTSRSTTATGTASDNLGVAKVEVGLDNATWVGATGTMSWSATLTLAEGANVIYVRATDTSGNTATTSVGVTVTTTPVWLWPLVALVIVGAAAGAYLVMRRRRKPAEETLFPQR